MTKEPLRELSLFSGAGGGLLASLLLGWHTVGYVEWDDYCQRVIAARIADGYLHEAPIFTDVREFLQSGYAAQYRGFVDVVSGGFPCQPFSVAGKRAGADDERNMWPATIECIRTVEPRYAFLENVPGLITSGYFGRILSDLAESGYDARWRVLSAGELGAPHKRDRLWIVAESQRAERRGNGAQRQANQRGAEPARVGVERQIGNVDVADADGGRCEQCAAQERGLRESDSRSPEVADAKNADGGPDGRAQEGATVWSELGGSCRGSAAASGWWQVEPDVGRVAHGVASRVDRLRALGNGQVPAVAAAAWRLLTEGM